MPVKKITIPFLKKLSVTLLCILVSAGVIYFYELLLNPTSEKLSNAFWAILFGISFAYVMNYKLSISSQHIDIKKNKN